MDWLGLDWTSWQGLCVFVALAAGLWYFIAYNPWAQKEWEHLPTLTEYRQRYPYCVQGEQVACCHCGSTVHLDVGLLQYTDWRRQTICRQCKNRLWREMDR
nr:hypothetical protein [uncultured Deefgea sp.]